MTMSFMTEIRSQPPLVRKILWALSSFIAISFIGYFWFTSFEREVFLAWDRTEEEQTAFRERQEARAPKPLAAISKGFGSLTAAIGDLFGFDRSAGFDTTPSEDTVYLLPLSE